MYMDDSMKKTELEAKCLAQQPFPFQMRRDVEQVNGQTNAPGVGQTILLPSSPLQRGVVGG